MRNLTPLTDEDIESDRKNGAHRRKQKIDDAFTSILVALFYVAGLVSVCFVVLCGGAYILDFFVSGIVSPEKIQKIENISTHILTGVGGYLIHLAKRNIGDQ